MICDRGLLRIPRTAVVSGSVVNAIHFCRSDRENSEKATPVPRRDDASG
jgi:hypothetical protein